MCFPIDVIGKDSAFNRDQYTDAYAPGIERLFWHVARNATILRWLRRCGMDAEKLLEIGCGPGIVVDYFGPRESTALAVILPARQYRIAWLT